MTFLKNTTKFNWDVEKQINLKRIYIWEKFKNFHKINIDRIKIFFKNFYHNWHNYIQSENQFVKIYNEKRIKFMFYLSSKLKFTLKMKLNVFHNDLLKKTRQELKYFLEFETKINFIAQVKRFENVDKEKKTKFKKRKKKNKKFNNENNNKNIKNKNKRNKSNDKKDYKNKVDKDNLNRLSMSKKKRLFRWIWQKHETIIEKKNCLECEKFDHIVHDCINKKIVTMSKSLTFRSKND